MPIPLQSGWLYGPIDSRRYGRSLGVNPLPLDRKLCSLDCLYCQYGFTRAQEVVGRAEVPAAAELAAAFDREFARLAAAGDRPDRITVAGNGEPTLHPDFLEISRELVAARDRHFPGAEIGILSNSMHLNREDVVTALNECYDEPAMKLEWGSAECFAAMNQVSPRGYERVLAGLERLRSFVVQALFMRAPKADNATEAEIAGWLDNLRRLRPRIRWVELYSLDRPPAAEARAERLPPEELEEIAERVRRLGLEARRF
ncbi:MAG: radical SAM protein [Planctomycetota bacterium]|nr:MAG: radical SAM protein [Planctomycetota bacterium]